MLRVSSCKLATVLHCMLVGTFRQACFGILKVFHQEDSLFLGYGQTLTLGEFDKVEKLSFAIVFCASVIMGAALDWFLASRFNCMRR